jgi:NTP pyrophosphatase (non-canonical NTP hydrolase)
MTRFEDIVKRLIDSRIPHRKGHILADMSLKDIWKKLYDEVMELGDEIEDEDIEKCKDELGDVYSIIVHLTQKLGTDLKQTEVGCEQKLYERFEGLKNEIPVPDDGPRLW